jgi:predicted MFS family arabinose efflux permease
MKEDQLHKSERVPAAPGQIKAGFQYVLGEPRLRTILLLMFIIGTFAYEFPVILPLFATVTLHGGAGTYSSLTVAMGIGAIVGGLYSAGSGEARLRRVIIAAFLFGCSLLLLAGAPGLPSALLVTVAVGALSILFLSLGNSTLQLSSAPNMRGRVMSMWSIAFPGTTPIGGPLIGLIADHSNPRIGLAVGGLSALVAAGLAKFVSR